MTIPSLALTRFAEPRPDLPLLVLGPSLGTSASALWTACAAHLARDFDVVAWDLPGHGASAGGQDGFTVEELASAVLTAVDPVLVGRGDPAGGFVYAGVSVGGVVGLQLLLDVPDRIASAVLVCTGAHLGSAEGWADRVAQVEASGTPSLVTASAERWFGPGFAEREPAAASALLHALRDAEDLGYAQVCRVLAGFDARDRLAEVTTPVLAIAGGSDPVAPPALMSELAEGVGDGRLVVLDGVAHLAPAEDPPRVAALISGHAGAERPHDGAVQTLGEVHDAGMGVRRAVLGDAHVDRAVARTTDLTRDFQELITTYAWGSIWTRPGLDRRSRSVATLTALVARGHHEELRMHLRAALRNGLTWPEISEVLLQSAIYCGVPDANTAFRIADEVRAEEEAR